MSLPQALYMVECVAPEDFAAGFPEWLALNWHVMCAFDNAVAQLAPAGARRRYAVAPVWEFMRQHTLIAEVGADYKLNNNHKADIARLYMMLRPEREGLFALRARSVRTVADEQNARA